MKKLKYSNTQTLKHSNKGFAIIAVLGVMMVLLIIGMSFIVSARLESKRGKNYLAMLRAKMAAEAGIEYACALIFNDTIRDKPFLEWNDTLEDEWVKQDENIKLPGDERCSFKIEIQDCESKVNLNACSYGTAGVGAPILSVDFSKLYANNFVKTNYFLTGLGMTTIFPELLVYYSDPGDPLNYRSIGLDVCSRSYLWTKWVKLNIYDALLDQYWAEANLIYEHLKTYYRWGNEIQQIALNINDYFDRNDEMIEYGGFKGREKQPFITEVMAETSALDPKAYTAPSSSNGGEFVEIFNPYDTEIDLNGWELKIGSVYHDLSSQGTISPKESIVITDDTYRTTNFNGPTLGFGDFHIPSNADRVVLSKNGTEIDVFRVVNPQTDEGLIENGDPRYIDVEVISQTATPGDEENFINRLWGSIFLEQEWDDYCVNVDGRFNKVNSVSQLRYIYRDTPNNPPDSYSFQYDYLRLSSEQIVSTFGHDLRLMENFYYFDNSLVDYFEDIDGIPKVDSSLAGIVSSLDELKSRERLSGRININTASKRVLMCLLGVTDSVANKIIDYREKNHGFKYSSEVMFALKQLGLSHLKVDVLFKNIIDLIAVQSNNFVVISRGYYEDEYMFTIKALIDRNFEDLNSDTSEGYDYPNVVWKYYIE